MCLLSTRIKGSAATSASRVKRSIKRHTCGIVQRSGEYSIGPTITTTESHYAFSLLHFPRGDHHANSYTVLVKVFERLPRNGNGLCDIHRVNFFIFHFQHTGVHAGTRWESSGFYVAEILEFLIRFLFLIFSERVENRN